MNYAIIIRPLIGSGIGYITNWIAVKMMFRPLNPVKIGKWNLPFTPGIIPRNKERIAKSIGDSINDYLLTEEVLRNSLLSETAMDSIKKQIIDSLNNLAENDKTIEANICEVVDSKTYNKTLDYINNNFTNSIVETMKESNIGDLIAKQIEIAANEKLKGSMLGLFGANAIVSKISEEASKKIDNYIEENGNELVSNMVEKEINKISNTRVSDTMEKIAESDIDLTEIILNMYERIILEKLPEMLKVINISKVVTDKINSMDMLELEKLILDIMKKELNALVNLGAIIGFVLGLLNLLF